MRLRLFSVAEQALNPPVIFDRFPASLANPARWNSHMSVATDDEACLIEELNGTFYAVAVGRSVEPLLNGRRFDSTPLLPGDRLTLGETTFVVSYERMTDQLLPATS